MKVLVLAGTRPEAIKLAPVMRELHRRDGLRAVLCNTGQHREMIRQAFDDFGIKPDVEFAVMTQGQTLAELSARLFAAIDAVLHEQMPDWVLVQGDTATAMVGAMCAFYRNIRVGHIEAGLRSFNRRAPFPEEVNRQAIGRVADLHFAATKAACANLIREGVDIDSIILTGNTVIDALYWMRDSIRGDEKELLDTRVTSALDAGRRVILVTGHRRENFGEGFRDICRAVRNLADTREDVLFYYPVHLNPNVQKPVTDILGGHPRILLAQPLAYREFIAHLQASCLVLTDSGGIQEEAPALGKPVLVMRDVTERPEGVKAGVARLVGPHATAIVHHVSELLDDAETYRRMARAANPYGDGHASERIADAIMNGSTLGNSL